MWCVLSRYIQYNPTSLERSHNHELLTEVDLGVPIDLVLPETYANTGGSTGGGCVCVCVHARVCACGHGHVCACMCVHVCVCVVLMRGVFSDLSLTPPN